MKRTSTLKRGGKSLKGKSPLSQLSESHRRWKNEYLTQLKNDQRKQFVFEGQTGEIRHEETLEPHHPFGRARHLILVYVYITPTFHRWIHDHENEAMKLGWLQMEFRGGRHNPLHPRPWKPGTLQGEHHIKP